MSSATTDQKHALTQKSLRSHLPVLDGIRGLAILMVLFHHGANMANSWWVDKFALIGLHFGGRGVDLFFVLSGFLITGIIYDTRGRKGYFTSFYARRILRIFPLYYLLIIISFYVFPNVGALLASLPSISAENAELIQSKVDRFGGVNEHQWYFWLFLSNFLIANLNNWGHGILGVSWSLAIEEQFYLLWPFLFLFLKPDRMKIVCIALLIFSPIFRAWLLLRGTDPFFGGEITHLDVYVLTPGRLEGLSLGALLALYLRGGSGDLEPERRLRKLTKPALFFAIFGIGLALLVALPRYFGGEAGKTLTQNLSGYFSYTIVAFGLTGVVILALASRPGTWWYRFWTSKFMCSFGKYSYAIYLTHIPVRAVIRDFFYGPHQQGDRFGTAMFQFPYVFGTELFGQLLFYIPMLAACWAVGWLSWHLYEKQFLKLKKFFPYGPKVTPKTTDA